MVKTRRPLPTPEAVPTSDCEVGFAKLQGEDFEYYMQTYSITLGRSSKKALDSAAGGYGDASSSSGGGGVDVDLGSLGGGMNISRRHARIFYDFPRRRFALEVLGKNGCVVEGVLHVPGSSPVKLDSQDLLQMGDKKFYFLLPSRSVFDFPQPQPVYRGLTMPGDDEFEDEEDGERNDDADEEEGEEENEVPVMVGGKRLRPAPTGRLVKNSGARPKVDRQVDDQQLLQLEEQDVISSVARVLSAYRGVWMPMHELHEELSNKFGSIWHHSRVRKYLTSEDFTPSEAGGRPWFGLLILLRKYPENFVIHTETEGRVAREYVALPAMLS